MSFTPNKKVIRAWTMFDWANSSFALVITTAIFPTYYNAITSSEFSSSEFVNFLGFQVNNGSLYAFAVSAYFLIAAAISPLLSGIADYTGKKKQFMAIFTIMGSLACAGLYFFDSVEQIELGIGLFVLAGVGYSGSIVYYNAYLPEIAPKSMHNKISAQGFALGYVGSVIHLVICLVFIMNPGILFDVDGLAQEYIKNGIAPEEANESANGYFTKIVSRYTFVSVGVWWLGFSLLSFYRLKTNVFNRKPTGNVLLKGYKEIRAVYNDVKTNPILAKFLIAVFFLGMGVQTILYMAVNFGTTELNLEASFLIAVTLVIQLVAIAGAKILAAASTKYGNLKVLFWTVMFWTILGIYGLFIIGEITFLIAAVFVGFVMGGTQAITRSTYSKLLPKTRSHASYFSFYDVVEKVGIVLGTFSFGLISQLTGSMKFSIIAIVVYFLCAGSVFYLLKRKNFSGEE